MSDKEYFCTDCGSSYRFGGGDLQYEVTNILCPSCSDEHIASLITRLAAAEAVVKEAFEFAAGFGDTVGRVNISGLRKSLQAYDKGKGGE